MARTKKRNTNASILSKNLSDLVIEGERPSKELTGKGVEMMSTDNIVEPTTKVKRPRGCPKKALLNTSKLLTTF